MRHGAHGVSLFVAGALIGLIVMRDPWPERLITALAWPLGVLAFAVVAVVLAAAAVYLWPVPLLTTIAVLTAVFYVLSRT